MPVTIQTRSGAVATYANGVWKCNRVGLLRYIEILDKADFSRAESGGELADKRFPATDDELRRARAIAGCLGASVVAYTPDDDREREPLADLSLLRAA
jgi:hypothetical protein